MTRKDYVRIVEALREVKLAIIVSTPSTVATRTAQLNTLDLVIENIANVLESDNSRFDRNRFIVAAKGIEGGK